MNEFKEEVLTETIKQLKQEVKYWQDKYNALNGQRNAKVSKTITN